jgi:Helix-turn-helix domain
MSEDWPNECVLCAARDRHTRLKFGHCCAVCADRLTADVRQILQLAAMASAELTPSTGLTSGVFGSRPPLNVAGLDPENTLVGPAPAPTVLDVLESWTRLVREERQMAPYGPWSAAEGAKVQAVGGEASATLTALVTFLAAQTEWIVGTPDFPLEDYRSEITDCVRALRRWDTANQRVGTMVPCPTITDDGECGCRLHYEDLADSVQCRRCRVTRDAATLAAVAMSDGREVWLDPEAAAAWLGISEPTLRRMARRGDIVRSHGRYLIRNSAGALDSSAM